MVKRQPGVRKGKRRSRGEWHNDVMEVVKNKKKLKRDKSVSNGGNNKEMKTLDDQLVIIIKH